jgi:hypothetical protein
MRLALVGSLLVALGGVAHACPHRTAHFTHDLEIVIGLAPLLLLLLLLGVLFVRAVRDLRMPLTGEAIELHVAEDIAQTTLRRATSLSIAMLAAVVSAWLLVNPLAAMVMTICNLLPLGTVIAARRVVAELAQPRARAQLRGTLLIVRSRTGQARVASKRRVIAAARRHSVPTSIAR